MKCIVASAAFEMDYQSVTKKDVLVTIVVAFGIAAIIYALKKAQEEAAAALQKKVCDGSFLRNLHCCAEEVTVTRVTEGCESYRRESAGGC